MSFQRFSFLQTALSAPKLTAKKLGVFRRNATVLFLLGAAFAIPDLAFGQARFFAPRTNVANERRESRTTNVAPTGIPARLDEAASPRLRADGTESVRRGNDVGTNTSNINNGRTFDKDAVVNNAGLSVGTKGSATSSSAANPDKIRDVRQTFSAPESIPSAGISLQIERRASREEAELEPTPPNGYLAIVPRVNFLKNAKDADENDGKRREIGIDARISTGVDASTSASASENDALFSSNAVENGANAEIDAIAAEREVVVFTLNNLQPDEARLLRDAEDGRWDEIDLFGAALIAEGLTTPERRAPYRAKYERLNARLAATLAQTKNPLKKTETIYSFLHDNVLTSKYNLNCSSLVASLDSGVFNCVSATTLFNCFAERSGLKVAALETTGHAKSRVKFDDSFLDLETTCSSWSRLPDKLRPYSRSVSVARPIRTSGGLEPAVASSAAKISSENYFSNASNAGATTYPKRANSATSDEVGTTTFDPKTFQENGDAAPIGYSYTKNRRPMREIGEVELVATIYYNVGVDFYQNERYEEAIAAYVKAARLAPNNLTILGNLKATLNNWAIQIAMKEKNFERAIQITEQGMILDPNFSEYKMNLPIFFQHWTTYLAKDNKWDEVARVEKEYRKRFPKATTR